MRPRMSWNVQDGEQRGELRNVDAVALSDWVRERGDRLALGAVHRHASVGDQLGDAAGMVGVMVGGEDRDQLELLFLQVASDRPGLAGVDDGRMPVVAQGPDVVVAECGYGNDVH